MIEFTKRDIKYFNIAKEISKLSDLKRTHIGAVITYKHEIISVGYNCNKTSTIQKKYNRFRKLDKDVNLIQNKVHAEINAISKIPYYIYENNFDFNKMAIYIWRNHKKTGIRALARPCPACYKALLDVGIRHVYYTGEDSFCYERIG